eukprot:Protomagalhaensia_wolfi_Nauph_80__16@NODE_1011_length_1812_cov_26_605189_g764_i0_p1_GENE_NODE_1011_length_1812_cov_26_605189_g764_i0NODE_1011_length_1812_cov_26_605189_g764_i0_p1_ORF_typecomplete_len368_score45_48Kelch_4/PF13418_6/0_00024Kelch_4/PF13418_6/1_8e06Kelch_4/PF13418_6/0_00022Kelch_6/PF13964_6/0_0032Kelch_6/PF13964_6/8_2e05Kelch_6/PF13964_6/0_00012Kelch_5/PF13854_6/0_81Kelch_5/PF13854_6/0_00068Kelch_5/PF13854_6/5_5e07Kelch_2/PF07646_15/0_0049Kelch_2/PF07646_15/0_0055Kelch_2/PF07646_15/
MASNLQSFLQRPLPAAAIQWHSQQVPSTPPRRITLISQSPPQSEDIIDWAEQTLSSSNGAWQPLSFVQKSIGREVFVARWLNFDATLPLAEVIQDRQRRLAGGHNGKRKKKLELGELLKLPDTPHFVTKPPLTISSSPLKRDYKETDYSPFGKTHIDRLRLSGDLSRPIERLSPVGGSTKILCHASAFVDRLTYVFAGLTQNGCSDELWSLDPGEGGWKRVQEKHENVPPSEFGPCLPGGRPCRRYNHTLVGWMKYLVVYAGDGAPGYLDDLWYFDTQLAEWDRISLVKEQKSSRPGARAGHTATVWGNQMIVFGGWRGTDGFCDVGCHANQPRISCLCRSGRVTSRNASGPFSRLMCAKLRSLVEC